jgi:hypothetical protein
LPPPRGIHEREKVHPSFYPRERYPGRRRRRLIHDTEELGDVSSQN